MRTILQDLRHGLRLFAVNPGFSLIAVLSLALGIGVNSAVFSVAEAALLRSFPGTAPERLARITANTPQGPDGFFSYADYQDLSDESHAFEGILAYSRHGKFVQVGAESRVILDDLVSPNYFAVLGVPTELGRTFSAADAIGEPTVVISDTVWRRLFNADPSLVGKSILLNGRSYTVLGIAAPGFRGVQRGVPTDLWVPATSEYQAAQLRDRNDREFELLGRVRAGVGVAQARIELSTIGRRLAQTYTAVDQARSVTLISEDERVRGALSPTFLLMAGVGLVLLICCANVAGLILARSETRRREIAVRLALGAGRGRLIRQLLTESTMLASAGAALGLLLASWLVRLQPVLMPPAPIELGLDLRFDRWVLLFTLAASALAVLVFGLVPAVQAGRINLVPALKGDMPAVGRSGHRVSARNLFVVGEIALSVVLVTASVSLVRSLTYSRSINLGFNTEKHLVFFDLAPGVARYDAERSLAFFEEATGRTRSTPGVTHASFARRVLLSASGGGAEQRVSIPGVVLPDNQPDIRIKFDAVAPDYFETVGTRLITGRTFMRSDGPSGARVVLISETMARRFWPDEDPVGRHVIAEGRDCQISGVVADAKINGIHEAPEPYMYVPFAQSPTGEGTLIVETTGDPHSVVATIRNQIHSLDQNVPVGVRTLDELLWAAYWQDSIAAGFVGALGALGLFLAAVGLYSVMAYRVNRRRQEIGIRMALGADRQDVVRLVFANGLTLAAIGTGAGLMVSLGATRLMASVLYGVKAADPLAFALSSAIVILVAAVATYVPARRAITLDPMAALRCE